MGNTHPVSVRIHMHLHTYDLQPLFYVVLASHEPPTGKFKSEGQKTRLGKRKLASDTLMRNREELFAGEFDG